MDGIVGLWHLNEAAGTSGAGSVKNDSGQGMHGTPTNITFGTSGALGLAANTSAGSISTASWTYGAAAPVQSYSAWFSTSQATTAMGLLSFSTTSTQGNFNIVFNGNNFITGSTAGQIAVNLRRNGSHNYVGYTGNIASQWSDGKWHHLVVVMDTAGSAGQGTATMYLDGSLVTITHSRIGTPGAFNYNKPFRIGTSNTNVGGYSGQVSFNGNIDEVAIWSRALHANEIKQLYQRGASRLKYQIRSCDDNACSGELWQGPDGTSGTYFSELNNNTTPLAQTGDVKATLPSMLFSNFTSPPASNQYFQYRTIFESDSVTAALQPELKSTTIEPPHYAKYASSNTSPDNTIIGNNGIAFYELNDFVQDLGGGGCDNGVFYNLALSNTGPWKHWTGTDWETADGSADEANTADELVDNSNAALAAFSTDVGRGSVFFKAFMTSDGISKCELDKILVGGDR